MLRTPFLGIIILLFCSMSSNNSSSSHPFHQIIFDSQVQFQAWSQTLFTNIYQSPPVNIISRPLRMIHVLFMSGLIINFDRFNTPKGLQLFTSNT